MFQGKRSVTTLGAGWGKAWGSGKEFPGCRHLAEHSLWLLGAAGHGPGLIRGKGMSFRPLWKKKRTKKETVPKA